MIWGLIAIVTLIVVAVVVTTAIIISQAMKNSKKDADEDFSKDTPAGKATKECPQKDKYVLVELIEVVTQDKLKYVEGPAKKTSNTDIVTEGLKREKKGGQYRQIINLDPATEGADKRHPEYGREITFRARVEQCDGGKDKLSGVKVNFTFLRTDGPNRTDPAGEPAVWKGADLVGDETGGFGSKSGTDTTSGTSLDDGWTGPIKFYTSQFGGDKFAIKAELDPAVKGAAESKPISTKDYEVWRKFWYQLSYAKGFAGVEPSDGEKAYEEIFAEMVMAEKKEFEKANFTADLQDRTFVPEFHVKQGGGNSIVCNVGLHNVNDFFTQATLKHNATPAQPLKDICIECEYQCDAHGIARPVVVDSLTARSKTITVANVDMITKPVFLAGADLVVSGSFGTAPGVALGVLTDANVTIEHGRATASDIKVTLPAAAPAPSVGSPVWIRLQLVGSNSYLGVAPNGAGQSGVVAVYVPGTAAGLQKSEEDFNDTVAHEFGHQFNQSPNPGTQPASLKNHPHQYSVSTGSHCRHGVPNHDCLLYEAYSASCSHKFCPVCKIHLQLEKMESFG